MAEKLKILIIGDICYDAYVECTHTRMSPENANVPVYSIQSVRNEVGMSLNVFKCLQKLNVEPKILTNVKEPKIQKTRVNVNGNPVHRIDMDKYEPDFTNDQLVDAIKKNHKFDGIIIQDYGKGTCTKEVIQSAIETGVKVFVDPYKTTPLEWYKGCYAILPNLQEAKALTGGISAEQCAHLLQIVTECNISVVTLSEDGVLAYRKDYPGSFITFPSNAKNIVDVTGCGDVVTAWFTVKQLETNSTSIALEQAMKAAAICIEQTGVYQPSQEEVANIHDSCTPIMDTQDVQR